MASEKVIVFGPTGNVGSVTAITAQEHGAQVVLAMRDPKKTIPGLSSEQEAKGGFERVQADLTQPDSVVEAVRNTKATRAFIYLAHGMPNGMKATIEALKSSGINFVVFLSSFTIQKELNKIQPQELIPWIHAQVEMSLEEVYGPENFVAVRPGAFATNTLMWRAGIQAGEIKLYRPETKFDFIAYEDMGKVSGSILAKGPKDGQHIVDLMGPQLIPNAEAIGHISKALKKEIKVTSIDEHEGLKQYMSAGTPEVIAKYLIAETKKGREGSREFNDSTYYETAVENTMKYTGKPATGFKQWTENNTHLYRA